jgi:hypothetical protein
MSESNPFPEYQKPNLPELSRERVVDYLLRLSSTGHLVEVDGDSFVLPRDDGEVRLRPSNGAWLVSRERLGVLSTYGDARAEDQLDRLMASAIGAKPERSTTGRLKADEPASNYHTIARLIGRGEIRAVFDTYLDNASLAQLIRIASFGKATFAKNVRLIGTTATTKTGPGIPPRLTKAGVDAWALQLQISSEARVLPKGTEHRRFLLLDAGRSLILGPSLNALSKNEAVAVEDDKEDLPFFDAQWSVAVPIA